LNPLNEKAGHKAVHLRSKFLPNTEDVQWIEALGKEGGWISISGDMRIAKLQHEREAWRQSKLTAFFMLKGWTSAEFWDQAWMLIRWWPLIIRQAEMVAPGAGFEIPFGSPGKLRQLSIGLVK
jgi:hypothetical protein